MHENVLLGLHGSGGVLVQKMCRVWVSQDTCMAIVACVLRSFVTRCLYGDGTHPCSGCPTGCAVSTLCCWRRFGDCMQLCSSLSVWEQLGIDAPFDRKTTKSSRGNSESFWRCGFAFSCRQDVSGSREPVLRRVAKIVTDRLGHASKASAFQPSNQVNHPAIVPISCSYDSVVRLQSLLCAWKTFDRHPFFCVWGGDCAPLARGTAVPLI